MLGSQQICRVQIRVDRTHLRDSNMLASVDFPITGTNEIETRLTDGRRVNLRPIRPSDQSRIRDGIIEMSDQARYLRFFSTFREPPEGIVRRLGAVDGLTHIGWGALLMEEDEHHAMGAAHAIRTQENSSTAELAIAVLDEYQGLGLARMLIAAVLAHCLKAGIQTMDIHILPENKPATTLMLSLGARRTPALDSVYHYTLDVKDALLALSHTKQPAGVADVLASFDILEPV